MWGCNWSGSEMKTTHSLQFHCGLFPNFCPGPLGDVGGEGPKTTHGIWKQRMRNHQEPRCLDLNPGPSPTKPTSNMWLQADPCLPFLVSYNVYLNSPWYCLGLHRGQINGCRVPVMIHSKLLNNISSQVWSSFFVLFLLFLIRLPFVSLGKNVEIFYDSLPDPGRKILWNLSPEMHFSSFFRLRWIIILIFHCIPMPLFREKWLNLIVSHHISRYPQLLNQIIEVSPLFKCNFDIKTVYKRYKVSGP